MIRNGELMCPCEEKKQDDFQHKHRRKIWELEDYLCSIIGTCLSIADLRKLGRRTEMEVDSSLSAYELHVLFVQEVCKPNHDSRLVNKKLDQKFQLAIKQAGRVKSKDDLFDFWRHSKEQNRLAGAYWAILTHPLAPVSLCSKIHGEIHMLSYLVTRRNFRADQKIKSRNTKIEVLQEALYLAQSQARQEQVWRDDEIAGLKMELLDKTGLIAVQQISLNHLAEFESGAKYMKLQNNNKQLQNELAEKIEICGTLTSENEIFRRNQQKLRRKLEKIEKEFTAMYQENKAMEHILHKQTTSCPNCDTCACKDCQGLDLCGCCVLYVGGQHSLVPHYRQVVNDCGGEFIHHDGGKEDQRSRLGTMMSKADVVICPVNYVSHDACLRAKKICKSQAKPFIPMRSAGLSALARGLEQVATGNRINLNLKNQ